jgi:Zn ribbon nucleic-acid-binding protein
MLPARSVLIIMEYRSETKQCQNCKKDFTIESDDFSFYEKMKVPAPTFCPGCRLQRRLAWYNLVNLFHRDCDLCGENFISMYPSEAPYVVYCPKCWWSDKWDFQDFGVDYDFSKPFFVQFNELMHKAPMLGLSITLATTVRSPYNNMAGDLKDCYLTFESNFNQECAYGSSVIRSRESFSSSMVMDTDLCYDCMCIYKSSRVVGTRGNNRFCIDCFFVRDCENCQDCFMCSGLRNKKYCFKNKEYSKEEYKEILSKYILSSYSGYLKAQTEAMEFWKTVSPKPAWDTLSVNCSGSYVFHSKNCHECYDVVDSEDCKYCMMLWNKLQKDCYDVTSFGLVTENCYDCNLVGEYASNILFSQESGIHSINLEYCKLAVGGENQFGCVSAHKGKNVILNKVYSKEEYKELRVKIIKHMNEMPYVDKKGNIYKYGEFFPIELSPFPYNMTFANLFNQKTNEDIESIGGYYLQENKNEYKITKNTSEIEDNIKDVNDEILNEVIGCEKCGRGYKVIEMELRFLKKMNLPIPHECPFCRINEKLNLWVDNMHLKDRVCDKCGKDFKTHFGKERAPIIYCKECYKTEFL